MVNKANLGKLPEWIQHRIRRIKWWLSKALTDNIVDRIAFYVGKSITIDPAAREGGFGVRAIHAKWDVLTVGGQYRLNAEERAKANKETGSLFNEPIFYFLCKIIVG